MSIAIDSAGPYLRFLYAMRNRAGINLRGDEVQELARTLGVWERSPWTKQATAATRGTAMGDAWPVTALTPVAGVQPDGHLHDDGCFTWAPGRRPKERDDIAGWRAPFYLAPQQPAPQAVDAERTVDGVLRKDICPEDFGIPAELSERAVNFANFRVLQAGEAKRPTWRQPAPVTADHPLECLIVLPALRQSDGEWWLKAAGAFAKADAPLAWLPDSEEARAMLGAEGGAA